MQTVEKEYVKSWRKRHINKLGTAKHNHR